MKRPSGLVLLAVAILVVFGGSLATVAVRTSGSGGPVTGASGHGPSTSSTGGSSAPGSSSSSAASTVVDPAVFVPPSGWQQVPDATAGTGAVDVTSAATLDGGGTLSAQALRQLGYVRGTTRQWRNPAEQGLVMVDLVYSFASATGAEGYVSSAVATRSASADFTPVDTPAGAPTSTRLFSGATTDGRVLVAIYGAGSRAVVLGLVRSGAAPTAAELVGLATRQESAAATAPAAVTSPSGSSSATSAPATTGSSTPAGSTPAGG